MIKNLIYVRNKFNIKLNKLNQILYINYFIEIIKNLEEKKKNLLQNIFISFLVSYLIWYIKFDLIYYDFIKLRIFFFIVIIILIGIYKGLIYILVKNIEKIKNILKENKIINKIGLIIIKWTNIIYIYNDILIMLIKIMREIRKKEIISNLKLFTIFEKFIYVFFFIIIKDLIINIVAILREIKKNIIEKKIKEIIKRRFIFWMIITIYLLKGFLFNLIIIIIYIVIKSLNISLDKLYREIMGEKYITWKYFRWESENWKVTEQPNLYDKLIEGMYLLKYCEVEEDLEIERFRWIATSKIMDIKTNKYLRLYNNEIYWYQPELYYEDTSTNISITFILRLLYLLKINIISLLRIEDLLKEENHENNREKLENIKKNYIYNLKLYGKIWKNILKQELELSIIYQLRLNLLYLWYDEGSYKNIYDILDKNITHVPITVKLSLKKYSKYALLEQVVKQYELKIKKEAHVDIKAGFKHYYKNLKKIKEEEKKMGIEENIKNVFWKRIITEKELNRFIKKNFGMEDEHEVIGFYGKLYKDNPEKLDELLEKYSKPISDLRVKKNSLYQEIKNLLDSVIDINTSICYSIFEPTLIDAYIQNIIRKCLLKNNKNIIKNLPKKLSKKL